MSSRDGFDDEPEHEEEESFGRPFLGRVMRAEPVEAVPTSENHEGHEEHHTAADHRPYLLTGGRTGGGESGIGIAMIASQTSYQVTRTWGLALVAGLLACLAYGITAYIGRALTPWAPRMER